MNDTVVYQDGMIGSGSREYDPETMEFPEVTTEHLVNKRNAQAIARVLGRCTQIRQVDRMADIARGVGVFAYVATDVGQANRRVMDRYGKFPRFRLGSCAVVARTRNVIRRAELLNWEVA